MHVHVGAQTAKPSIGLSRRWHWRRITVSVSSNSALFKAT
jgi:hypothetical protein